MSIKDNISEGFEALFCPSKAAAKDRKIKGALKIYYSVAIVGFVFAAIIFTANYFSSALPLSGTGWAGGQFGELVFIAFLLFVAEPLGLFIDAALLQLIGKYFLKSWRGDYSRTFTAQMFSAMPAVLLFWLLIIPDFYVIALFVVMVWDLVILTIALSQQQKVKRADAMVAIATMTGIVFAIAFAIAIIVLGNIMPFGYGGLPMGY